MKTPGWLTGSRTHLQMRGIQNGSLNSSTLHGVSNHAPDVAFPRRMEDTAQNAGLSLQAPALSTGAQWDGSLKTLEEQVRRYSGPDTKIKPWLLEKFGPDPKGQTTRSLRTATRLVDGQIAYHDVLVLAHEWDESGESQPHEFLEALRFEIEGTRQTRAVNAIMVGLTTGRPE